MWKFFSKMIFEQAFHMDNMIWPLLFSVLCISVLSDASQQLKGQFSISKFCFKPPGSSLNKEAKDIYAHTPFTVCGGGLSQSIIPLWAELCKRMQMCGPAWLKVVIRGGMCGLKVWKDLKKVGKK